MTEDVLPQDAPSTLRVQATSKLAFGATTAALVTLASSGTAVLVSHGTASIQAPTALPPGVSLPDSAAAAGDLVVDRAAGSYGQVVQTAAAPVAEDALREALARRAEPGRRTLTVPLVDLGLPVLEPPAPVVEPVPPVVKVPHTPHVPGVGRGNGEGHGKPVVVPVVGGKPDDGKGTQGEGPKGPQGEGSQAEKPHGSAGEGAHGVTLQEREQAQQAAREAARQRAQELREQQRAEGRAHRLAEQSAKQAKLRERAEKQAAREARRHEREHEHGLRVDPDRGPERHEGQSREHHRKGRHSR